MEQKYYSVGEIARIYGKKPAKIRDYCHAKGQNFAIQIAKGGNLSINIEKFDKWFSMYHAKGGPR